MTDPAKAILHKNTPTPPARNIAPIQKNSTTRRQSIVSVSRFKSSDHQSLKEVSVKISNQPPYPQHPSVPIIIEKRGTSAVPLVDILREYTWGPDLSGSMQGAGGVGGLLKVKQGSRYLYPSYDGNGNIIAWSDLAGSGTTPFPIKKIDYDGFGNKIAEQGAIPSGDIPFGFSTKYEDVETGLLYYGYRYYDPVTGRWPSRDPIGENGGENLYSFVLNRPSYFVDVFGNKGIPAGVKPSTEGTTHENDAGRVKRLKDARNLVKDKNWKSRDAAGTFGATLAVTLTFHGVRAHQGDNPAVNVEYGGNVCCKCIIGEDKTVTLVYSITPPVTTLNPKKVELLAMEPCPEGTTLVGGYHSHPGPSSPSQPDRNLAALADRWRAAQIKEAGGIQNECQKANPRYKEYVGIPDQGGKKHRVVGTDRHGNVTYPFGGSYDKKPISPNLPK